MAKPGWTHTTVRTYSDADARTAPTVVAHSLNTPGRLSNLHSFAWMTDGTSLDPSPPLPFPCLKPRGAACKQRPTPCGCFTCSPRFSTALACLPACPLQLACDVKAVLPQQGLLSATVVVEHLARELTGLGYIVTLHSSLCDKHDDYLKNLRHTFLTCQLQAPPGAPGRCTNPGVVRGGVRGGLSVVGGAVIGNEMRFFLAATFSGCQFLAHGSPPLPDSHTGPLLTTWQRSPPSHRPTPYYMAEVIHHSSPSTSASVRPPLFTLPIAPSAFPPLPAHSFSLPTVKSCYCRYYWTNACMRTLKY